MIRMPRAAAARRRAFHCSKNRNWTTFCAAISPATARVHRPTAPGSRSEMSRPTPVPGPAAEGLLERGEEAVVVEPALLRGAELLEPPAGLAVGIGKEPCRGLPEQRELPPQHRPEVDSSLGEGGSPEEVFGPEQALPGESFQADEEGVAGKRGEAGVGGVAVPGGTEREGPARATARRRRGSRGSRVRKGPGRRSRPAGETGRVKENAAGPVEGGHLGFPRGAAVEVRATSSGCSTTRSPARFPVRSSSSSSVAAFLASWSWCCHIVVRERNSAMGMLS